MELSIAKYFKSKPNAWRINSNYGNVFKVRNRRSKKGLKLNTYYLLGLCKVLFSCFCLSGFVWHVSEFLTLYFRYPTRMELYVEFVQKQTGPYLTLANHNNLRDSAICSWKNICRKNKPEETDLRLSKKYKRIKRRWKIFDIYKTERSENLFLAGHQLRNMLLLYRDDHRYMKEGLLRKNRKHTNSVIDANMNIWWGRDRWNYNSRIMEFIRTSNKRLGQAHGNFYTLGANITDVLPYGTDGKTIKNIFNLYLFLETNEYVTRDTANMKIMIHDKTSLPTFYDGDVIQLFPGFKYNVLLKKVETILLPKPYLSDCKEYGAKSYKICRHEARLQKSMVRCNCIKINDLTILSEEEASLKCYGDRSFVDNCYNKSEKELDIRICQFDCKEITYDFTITRHPLTNDDIKDLNSNTTELSEVVNLKVSFKNGRKLVHAMRPQYQNLELFSYLGGYMGIWLGLSFLQLPSYATSLIYRISQRKSNLWDTRSSLRRSGHSKKIKCKRVNQHPQ